MKITEYLKDHILYLDGGMGTLLQQRGLAPGELPERWNLTHPEVIRDIHRAYYDAGSNVVCTNTFGASSLKLSHEELDAVIGAAVENARAASLAGCGKQPKCGHISVTKHLEEQVCVYIARLLRYHHF